MVTKNLENFLTREKEIDDLEEEVRKSQLLDMSNYTDCDDIEALPIEKIQGLKLMFQKDSESEQLRTRLLFFLFLLTIFMVNKYNSRD